MLKTEHQLSFSSRIQHPYNYSIYGARAKLLIALTVKLLNKFVEQDKDIISNNLNLIFEDNLVIWKKYFDQEKAIAF